MELWQLQLRHVDWVRYIPVVEGVKGQGLGLAVLIERYLLSPENNVWTLLDEEFALMVAFIAVDGKMGSGVHPSETQHLSDREEGTSA